MRIAFGRKRFVLAVRLADAAIALRGAAGVDPLGGNRLMAARAAGGWRLGSDWTTLDAAGRQSLPEKARAWITSDVAALEGAFDQMPERDRRLALQWTNEALHAPELEGLRSAAATESRAASASGPTSRPAADDLWGRIACLRDRLRATK